MRLVLIFLKIDGGAGREDFRDRAVREIGKSKKRRAE